MLAVFSESPSEKRRKTNSSASTSSSSFSSASLTGAESFMRSSWSTRRRIARRGSNLQSWRRFLAILSEPGSWILVFWSKMTDKNQFFLLKTNSLEVFSNWQSRSSRWTCPKFCGKHSSTLKLILKKSKMLEFFIDVFLSEPLIQKFGSPSQNSSRIRRILKGREPVEDKV